ncbi:unnamed protein product [Schistocephalus solidus]|uniref:Uncharacterized protein n=1 Tax=Schistocephalus solidus TaxID=70667 RepID=A0A183TFW8_SCHSO|nr:unnamed protein product [Schistocephalus solidus]
MPQSCEDRPAQQYEDIESSNDNLAESEEVGIWTGFIITDPFVLCLRLTGEGSENALNKRCEIKPPASIPWLGRKDNAHSVPIRFTLTHRLFTLVALNVCSILDDPQRDQPEKTALVKEEEEEEEEGAD